MSKSEIKRLNVLQGKPMNDGLDFEDWFNQNYKVWDTEFKKQIKAAFKAGQAAVIARLPSEDRCFIKINELYYAYGRETISRITGKELCNEFYYWLRDKLTGDK